MKDSKTSAVLQTLNKQRTVSVTSSGGLSNDSPQISFHKNNLWVGELNEKGPQNRKSVDSVEQMYFQIMGKGKKDSKVNITQ